MIELSIGFAIGLVIGWFVLPKPAWAQNLWNKAEAAATTAETAAVAKVTPASTASTSNTTPSA